MNEILKAAVVQQQAVGPEELALINKQSLRELPGIAGRSSSARISSEQ